MKVFPTTKVTIQVCSICGFPTDYPHNESNCPRGGGGKVMYRSEVKGEAYFSDQNKGRWHDIRKVLSRHNPEYI